MKFWERLGRVLLLSVGCLAVVPIKCNSIFAPRKLLADEDQYEYVTRSGSHIAVRVKKGQRAEGASAMDEISADTFRKAVDRNTLGPKPGN